MSALGLQGRAPAGGYETLEARVLSPPVSVAGFLRVEAVAQPGRVREVPWGSRIDMQPLPGDAALIAESDGGQFWCVTWWPQGGQAPAEFPTLAALAAVQAQLDATQADLEATQADLASAQATLDARLDTLEAPPTWTAFTGLYLNSWTEYDSAHYSKDALGYVQFRGEIRAWAGGTTAADVGVLTLPVGFRPVIRTGCPVWSNDAGQLSLYVNPTGAVYVSRAVGASVVVNIGSVRFPTR